MSESSTAGTSAPTNVKAVIMFGGVFLLVALVATFWMHPKLVRADPLALGATGIVLSAWGLILAIGGFGITWWQLHRSRTAAQRVAETVSDMRRDYAAFDVITELRTARAAAEKIQEAVTILNWPEAAIGYRNIRVSLMKMASSVGVLNDENIAECKDHVAKVMAAANFLQKSPPRPEDAAPVGEMLEQMGSVDNYLIALEQSLKGSFRANR
ncbi:hypothetical protein [Brevundimonas sp.]|uniref:hypothetical protein n=1 Tax=Brevundimonas sp. TaxID=1871086 RepID=UPI0028A0E24D|nr:hypothetical protein [Brevundimonas sp.]